MYIIIDTHKIVVMVVLIILVHGINITIEEIQEKRKEKRGEDRKLYRLVVSPP